MIPPVQASAKVGTVCSFASERLVVNDWDEQGSTRKQRSATYYLVTP